MSIEDPSLPSGATGNQIMPTSFIVCRYDPDSGEAYAALPNLEFISGRRTEGPKPSVFKIRYAFGLNLRLPYEIGRTHTREEVIGEPDPAFPVGFEQVLGTGYSSSYIVEPGDRLVVLARAPGSGGYVPIFDGYALDFELHLDAGSEVVEIACEGVERTARYTPISGAYVRDAANPTDSEANVQIGLAVRFNPKGKPNATPDGADAENDSGRQYPVFVDPSVVLSADVGPRTWDLPMACKYLAYHHNPDEDLVLNPDPEEFDALIAIAQKDPLIPVDPEDPATFEESPIPAPDKPISNRAWPDLIGDLIGGRGFGMSWDLDPSDSGPGTKLRIFKQQDGDLKNIYLQPYGSEFDIGMTNVASMRVTRRLSEVANEVRVAGAPKRKEASFVLHALFPMAAGDSSASNLVKYDRASADYDGAKRTHYRLFGVDECGEGHYSPGSGTVAYTAWDPRELFGSYEESVRRRRKPVGKLFTKDTAGRPYHAKLSYCTDYAGDAGKLWDPSKSGTWKPIDSGWKLLDDRIGFEVTIQNPNAWTIGHDRDAGHPIILNLIETLAAGGSPGLLFRLTVVVEADSRCVGVALKPQRSSMDSAVVKIVDASDRCRMDIVSNRSEFWTETGGDPGDNIVRDDTAIASSEAAAFQSQHRNGVFDGPVVIPYFTTYYKIGDRIGSLEGRGLGFRTDSRNPDDVPTYPAIVAVEWTSDAERGQHTILHLSDAGLSRRGFPIRRGGRRLS